MIAAESFLTLLQYAAVNVYDFPVAGRDERYSAIDSGFTEEKSCTLALLREFLKQASEVKS